MRGTVTKHSEQEKNKVKAIISLHTSEKGTKKKEILVVWTLTYAGSKSN